MDSLILPVLTEGHTIDEALERMAHTDSRAIVVQHFLEQFGYVLYMNQAVADAWKNREPTCSELRDYDGEAVAILDRFAMPATIGSLEQLIERELDQKHALLGVLFPPRTDDDLMTVVTRHETKRDSVAMAGQVCGCSGPFRHVDSSPPAASGGPCPFDGYPYNCW